MHFGNISNAFNTNYIQLTKFKLATIWLAKGHADLE